MVRESTAGTVIGENLALLAEESTSADERKLAWLRDLAMLMLRRDSSIFGETRSDDFSALFESTPMPEDIPEDFLHHARFRNRAALFSDKLTVCRFLAEELERRGVKLLERLLGDDSYKSSPKIAYFKNAYADAAFRIFSDVLDTPSVVYAPDFTAVCEEVYYGRADMCMLPLDSSRDAKLISFYRLIDKYELNPVFSCDVTTPDGSVTTRYALLKRAIALPDKTKRSGCFFEFSLVPDDGATLGDVLSAAAECGLTLYKVDSIPLTYNSSEFSCEVILKVGDAPGLDAFVLFLTLAMPQYEPLGIYPHIRQGE
ncbi:MAG: hypothetical protein IJ428_04665 [Clostridia bacterium]|nr:hypothetical protein [Clostridia bacterium]